MTHGYTEGEQEMRFEIELCLLVNFALIRLKLVEFNLTKSKTLKRKNTNLKFTKIKKFVKC